MEYILQVKNLLKMYDKTETALKNVSVNFARGTFTTIVGPSGSGKSTLLNIISGLLTPTAGAVIFKGIDITKYNSEKLAFYRRHNVSHIFQEYNLLDDLTVNENILLGMDDKSQRKYLDDLMKDLGISEFQDKFPSQLSGGEQQRVSIARAMIKNPELIFCDEATGALDEENSKKVVSLLCEIQKKYKTTVIFITHNQEIAKTSERIITMKNGTIISDYFNNNRIDAQDMKW
ncbi:ABC transporter ATP-binding protein [Clostridium estertheticum]|uniref:ABC transporter ATP-binding protein n=1 Tax=Clostridium estertheticum TaxID=238834 RepID=UPI001CF3EBA8|nr:ABC transporter ATP-binding protein [Clostridium estertheticum]MCB2340481.1 ABC transporter ATP-binding protein [Clostridium estertheticum]